MTNNTLTQIIQENLASSYQSLLGFSSIPCPCTVRNLLTESWFDISSLSLAMSTQT